LNKKENSKKADHLTCHPASYWNADHKVTTLVTYTVREKGWGAFFHYIGGFVATYYPYNITRILVKTSQQLQLAVKTSKIKYWGRKKEKEKTELKKLFFFKTYSNGNIRR
jgi:hypothetical protein